MNETSSNIGGNQTVCEVNGRIISADHTDAYSFVENLYEIPQAQFSLDHFHRCTKDEDPVGSAFLEKNDTFYEKIVSAWRLRGVSGLLKEISISKSEDNVPNFVKHLASYFLKVSCWLASMQINVYPHLKLSDHELAAEFSPNNNWQESCVRLLAWHPHTNKFALALIDDTVRVCYNDNELVPILKHKKQRNITDLKWKPQSASTLAVASQTCILIWNVDPTSLSTRPSSGGMQILTYPPHTPVTSIEWSPSGFDLLFSCSALSSSIVVWDVCLNDPTVVSRIDNSGGICKFYISPDGSKMVVGTTSSSFRVFETVNWTHEQWSKLEGRLQTACWTPKATTLLFSCSDGKIIYSLSFADSSQSEASIIDGSKNASIAIDLNYYCSNEINNSESESSCNLIHSIVMNKTGDRLAVLFDKDYSSAQSQVALFTTSEDPLFAATPNGYVNGPDDSVPTFITFKPSFQDGALLTVCSVDGGVLHIPLFFKKDKNRSIAKPHLNMSSFSVTASGHQNFINESTQSYISGYVVD